MYIFGYGSLINSASRRLTGQTGRAIPASATGLVRYFGKIDDSYILSPLVVHLGDGQINGVLLEIDEVALAEFDRRERGYQRFALTADRIHTQEYFVPENRFFFTSPSSINRPVHKARSCKPISIPYSVAALSFPKRLHGNLSSKPWLAASVKQ